MFPVAPASPIVIVALLAAPTPAFAYVGPGAGVSLIWAVMGLFLAVGTALGLVLLAPLKLAYRRLRGRPATSEPAGGEAPPQPEQQ